MIITPSTPNVEQDFDTLFTNCLADTFNTEAFYDTDSNALAFHREANTDFQILINALLYDYRSLWNKQQIDSSEQFSLNLQVLEYAKRTIARENRTEHDAEIIRQIELVQDDMRNIPIKTILTIIPDHQNLTAFAERYLLHTDDNSRVMCCLTEPATEITGSNNCTELKLKDNTFSDQNRLYTATDQEKIGRYSTTTIWYQLGNNNDHLRTGLIHRAQTTDTHPKPRALIHS